MEKGPVITDTHIELCSGVKLDKVVDEAKAVATNIYNFYKDRSDAEGRNFWINVEEVYEPNYCALKYKFAFNVIVPTDSQKQDFVIEVNIIIGIFCYKFDMRF